MGNTIDDGGPTFPVRWGQQQHDGMTLRDYFAARTVSAMLSHHEFDYSPLANGKAKTVARDAYEIADAMIEARKAEKS